MGPVVVTSAMKGAVQRNFDASVSAYDAYERRTHRFTALARLLGAEMAARAAGPFDRLLDAGAGSGVSTRVLAQRANQTVALDLSREMLRANDGDARVLADFDRLPFADDSFDGVAFTASLFLVPDPTVALAEARRVLRSGGVVGAVAPLGWYTDAGDDIFDSLPRDSRSPTPATEVAHAVESAFSTTTGAWSFPTTAANVRQFHAIPAMAARLFPRLDPDERVQRTSDLLAPLAGTFEQRWRWIVGVAD